MTCLSEAPKLCIKCKQLKDAEHFYKHPAMKDGRLGKCSLCCRTESVANREKNLERYREHDRRRGSTEERIARNVRTTRKRREAFPWKHGAHREVQKALKNGVLLKAPCSVCGVAKVEAHHEDYEKPLDVVWLAILEGSNGTGN